MCSLFGLSFSFTSFMLFSFRIYNLLRVAFNGVPRENIFIISALVVIWKLKFKLVNSNVTNNCKHQLTREILCHTTYPLFLERDHSHHMNVQLSTYIGASIENKEPLQNHLKWIAPSVDKWINSPKRRFICRKSDTNHATTRGGLKQKVTGRSNGIP